jgi:hypothetical protein
LITMELISACAAQGPPTKTNIDPKRLFNEVKVHRDSAHRRLCQIF